MTGTPRPSHTEGEIQFEIGDRAHVNLRQYNDGIVIGLDEDDVHGPWEILALGALTHPETPFRYELADDRHLVDWQPAQSVVIYGPHKAEWNSLKWQ
jgi:hypothetical protein